MYVPDNYDAYRWCERDRERDEYLLDKITDTEEVVESVISILEDAEPSEEVSRAIAELDRLLNRL